jgi:hypothetical protein
MKRFDHMNVYTLDDAARAMEDGAAAIAGGTDLLGVLKDKILEQYPKQIVNLKTIEGLEYIEEDGDAVRIGANTKLSDIMDSPLVRQHCRALADAAYAVASPLIRRQATIGGNICQNTRCWYYRYPHHIGGRIVCLRKGGDGCHAFTGEHKYHSIFGGMRVHRTACSESCPAHVDIPQYLERVRESDLDGAAAVLLSKNPLSAVTSRVCAHFCMEGCHRGDYDDPVNIGQIERYIGDYPTAAPTTRKQVRIANL